MVSGVFRVQIMRRLSCESSLVRSISYTAQLFGFRGLVCSVQDELLFWALRFIAFIARFLVFFLEILGSDLFWSLRIRIDFSHNHQSNVE